MTDVNVSIYSPVLHELILLHSMFGNSLKMFDNSRGMGHKTLHMCTDHAFSLLKDVVMSLIVVFTITPHLSLALTTFDRIP